MSHEIKVTKSQNFKMESMSKEGLMSVDIKPRKLTPADIKRKARNIRKAASKINLTIIPLPSRTGNPKKNPSLRRQRGKSGVYIPYVLLNIDEFRSNKYQKKINQNLINRAYQARQDGGYFHINPKVGHEEGVKKDG